MKAKKNIKIMSLMMSIIAIILTSIMLVGSTFAWFTDTAVSSGNKIQAGSLKVDLQLLNEDGDWNSLKTSNAPIFDYDLWEPGYTDVKVLKVVNEGNLEMQWKALFISETELTELANVIDVYVKPSDAELTYPENRSLEGYSCVGTVADFINNLESTTKGTLSGRSEAYLGIALKMNEQAGNEYQGISLGGAFDIVIQATQYSAESDSFGSDYDENAPFDTKKVYTKNQLNLALANRENEIMLMNDIEIDATCNVFSDVQINGNGYSLTRENRSVLTTTAQTAFTGNIFWVEEGVTLELENIIVDGGAIWTGEENAYLKRGMVNSGSTATGYLVGSNGSSTVILGEGAILQNNDGANAVNLGTRTGSKLIINGGEIINNHAAAGAIWGGFSIELNSGKINGNHGGLGGAIRAVTNIGTILTMNGGEMNHNYSDANGGAIWAGTSASNNVYELNGGEMAYNYSATTGGAIYVGYKETLKIGGTFKMHDNYAPVYAAIRFHNSASFIMTGGEIYNNGEGNSIFLNNNSASITGGKIVDSFGYSGGVGLTWGNAEVDGVITYDLSTNHNTAYLAKEFATLKFFVKESSNFNNFNFKPAADYVYTEGDEAKLICQNEGYETYWDASTSTFRLRAI